MRASEWQFLCAVHEQPKSCCAIDYCCHTLDWAANIVTDPKIFPSRFVVSSDAHVKGFAVKNLVNVFRRLHRIFAHAWFQHRSVFWDIEGRTGLYVFFKTVCDLYDLLPAENYKLPPEAEGLEPHASEKEDAEKDAERERQGSGGEGASKKQPGADGRPVSIIKPPRQSQQSSQPQDGDNDENADDGGKSKVGAGPLDGYQSIGRTNTRRHIRASPSTGSAVTTVMETDEEEGDVASKMRELSISAPETVEEESEVEVPVIVEQDVMADATPKGDAQDASLPGLEGTAEAISPEGEPGQAISTSEESSEPQLEVVSQETAATDAEIPAPEPHVETVEVASNEEEAGDNGDEDEGDVTIVEETSQEAETSADPPSADISVEEKPVEPEEDEKEDLQAEKKDSDKSNETAPPAEVVEKTETKDDGVDTKEEPAKDA